MKRKIRWKIERESTEVESDADMTRPKSEGEGEVIQLLPPTLPDTYSLFCRFSHLPIAIAIANANVSRSVDRCPGVLVKKSTKINLN